jgi:beta-aspartyl-peptidase (threonine type)
MEDSGHFNAGKGSTSAVFYTNDNPRDPLVTHEMDAAIMDGRTLEAGAVGSVSRIRNPIRAARALLGEPRVFMVGPSADSFFQRNFENIELIDPKQYFKKPPPHKETSQLDSSPAYGTVGAVAIDGCNHLAAATSTGGLGLKPSGRIGDSPIIGAGTYANDQSCAVSATGEGEYIIRGSIAMRVAAGMEYGKLSLAKSASFALDYLDKLGGMGGFISIDRKGHTHISSLMYMPVASIDEEGKVIWPSSEPSK